MDTAQIKIDITDDWKHAGKENGAHVYHFKQGLGICRIALHPPFPKRWFLESAKKRFHRYLSTAGVDCGTVAIEHEIANGIGRGMWLLGRHRQYGPVVVAAAFGEVTVFMTHEGGGGHHESLILVSKMTMDKG